jgi:signal transduction histidine kinase
MIAGAALIHRLDKLSEQAQLEVISSAAAERRKISADMHDSIGASLAALLAHFTTDNVNVGDVRRRLGEILMELRFLVDSSESDDGDFNLVLGNVRHRMAASIELAGIALSWQVEELPPVRGLGARDALAIKLILMEALTNVLHHASAATASLTARHDVERSVIVVTVADDGCGFDPALVSGGRGLANMRRRTASISTGATMVIEPAKGRGTIVRVEVKVPAV